MNICIKFQTVSIEDLHTITLQYAQFNEFIKPALSYLNYIYSPSLQSGVLLSSFNTGLAGHEIQQGAPRCDLMRPNCSCVLEHSRSVYFQPLFEAGAHCQDLRYIGPLV